MTVGIGLEVPMTHLVGLARQAEARGVDSIWVSEITSHAFVQAAAVAAATDRLPVGTNIALAFPRSPTLSAMAAWDLDTLLGGDGRFVLGLGSQVRRIVEERFSAEYDPVIGRMLEYVRAVRAVLRTAAGDRTAFEGDLYQILRPDFHGEAEPSRPIPKIFVAGVGPQMVRAATRVADGLLGHSFTSPRYLASDVVPRVEEGLSNADRRRTDFTVCTNVLVSIADDPDIARREARRQIAFYGTTPNYRRVFEAEGHGELSDLLRDAWRKRSSAALADALPEEAIDTYAIAGTAEDVRGRLSAYLKHVDDVIITAPWYEVPAPRVLENLTAIIESYPNLRS